MVSLAREKKTKIFSGRGKSMDYILVGTVILLLFILSKTVLSRKKKEKRQSIHRVKPADKAERKGERGEIIVKEILSQLGEKYICLHDIMVQENERTSQVDHVIISPFGIFVIETKACNSYIKGDEDAKKWVQFLKNQQRYEFYNPIKQNAGHIKALRNSLKDTEKTLPFISIIVFVGTKGIEVQATKAIVIQENELLAIIRKYSEILLSVEQVKSIAQTLQDANIVSEDIRQQHVADIQKRGEQVENRICPSCGGSLVERAGKYGLFLSCSAYPRCRFTVNLKQEKELVQS
jgi:hypothetical protein